MQTEKNRALRDAISKQHQFTECPLNFLFNFLYCHVLSKSFIQSPWSIFGLHFLARIENFLRGVAARPLAVSTTMMKCKKLQLIRYQFLRYYATPRRATIQSRSISGIFTEGNGTSFLTNQPTNRPLRIASWLLREVFHQRKKLQYRY